MAKYVPVLFEHLFVELLTSVNITLPKLLLFMCTLMKTALTIPFPVPWSQACFVLQPCPYLAMLVLTLLTSQLVPYVLAEPWLSSSVALTLTASAFSIGGTVMLCSAICTPMPFHSSKTIPRSCSVVAIIPWSLAIANFPDPIPLPLAFSRPKPFNQILCSHTGGDGEGDRSAELVNLNFTKPPLLTVNDIEWCRQCSEAREEKQS